MKQLRRSPPPLEKAVQRAVVAFYRQVGCVVKSTSQARRSKVALGLPDLLVFWPARRAFWWHETKREGGKLSAEQERFCELAIACGQAFVVGGVREAVGHVERIRAEQPDREFLELEQREGPSHG